MNNEIEIFDDENIAEIVKTNELDYNLLQNFIKALNTEPPQELIKINKFANNTKYLPISFLEMLLDQISLGNWEVTEFRYQVVANELVGTIELSYYHPIFKKMIKRIGAGAVQIQTRAGTDAYDVNNKIVNTLTKQMGQLKAECFRNACKNIGKIFGRDLNREDVAEYEEAYKEDGITINLKKKVLEKIQNVKR